MWKSMTPVASSSLSIAICPIGTVLVGFDMQTGSDVVGPMFNSFCLVEWVFYCVFRRVLLRTAYKSEVHCNKVWRGFGDGRLFCLISQYSPVSR